MSEELPSYHKWYIDIIKCRETINGLKRQALKRSLELTYESRTHADDEELRQWDIEIAKYEEAIKQSLNSGSKSPIPVLSTLIIWLYIWARGLDANNLNPPNYHDIQNGL